MAGEVAQEAPTTDVAADLEVALDDYEEEADQTVVDEDDHALDPPGVDDHDREDESDHQIRDGLVRDHDRLREENHDEDRAQDRENGKSRKMMKTEDDHDRNPKVCKIFKISRPNLFFHYQSISPPN